ncbi:MAG: hypothetical protein GY868_14050, partial [Deltaproteobacteria bacterium]|nr:hypothetical protein [Deltaproteobacteria bacterium]
MIQLQPPVKAQSEPLDELKRAMSTATCIYEHCFQLDKVFRLAAGAVTDNKTIQIFLITNKPTPLKLHWGIARSNRFEWLPPPRQLQPDQTEIVDNKAAQTPFTKNAPGNTIKISMPVDEQVRGIVFVLFQPQDSTWINNKGGNFYIPLQPEQMQANGQIPDPGIAELTDIIIENEVNKNSWTLMHRYNLCHDLLNHEFPDDERLAVLFVWLRFSQIRQLDWQRNYNTQPRELSHSIDRLTNTIAAMYVDAGQQAQLLRLIIATLGHGNDGQRIRDEILHIMHRHHIKEISGSFMEEWHQKLHNNTTPDDVVICEAYIAFMHSSGSHDVFYAHLEQHGITRKRLENFERPIKSSPTYISHLHDALIYDFGKFLEILKAVHSGTDLKTAINAAQHLLGQDLCDLCSRILHTGETNPGGALEQAHAISRVRAHIHERLSSFSESQHVRDFLFLDLALDDFQRICIENLFSSNIDNDILVDLICVVLDQL